MILELIFMKIDEKFRFEFSTFCLKKAWLRFKLKFAIFLTFLVWVFDGDHLCSVFGDHLDGDRQVVGIAVSAVDCPEAALPQNLARRVQLAEVLRSDLGIIFQHPCKGIRKIWVSLL